MSCECCESLTARITGIPDWSSEDTLYAASAYTARVALRRRLTSLCSLVGHRPIVSDRNITGEARWCDTCGAVSFINDNYDPTAPRRMIVNIKDSDL